MPLPPPSSSSSAPSTLNRADVERLAGEQRLALAAKRKAKRIDTPSSGASAVADAVVELDLSRRGLEDVQVLAHYRKLGRLDLSDNRLSSLSCLSMNTELRWLKASRNTGLTSEGMSSLASLAHMRVLQLDHNHLTELSPVCSAVPSLQTLVVAHNPLVSAEGVERLSGLATLDLCGCGLRQLPSLAGLTKLTKLLLSANALTRPPLLPRAGRRGGDSDDGGGGVRARGGGLRELRLDRNALRDAGGIAWICGAGLKVLLLGGNPQLMGGASTERGGEGEGEGTTAVAEEMGRGELLLAALAGSCKQLEVLSVDGAAHPAGGGGGGRLSTEVLHALPRLKRLNGQAWRRDMGLAQWAAGQSQVQRPAPVQAVPAAGGRGLGTGGGASGEAECSSAAAGGLTSSSRPRARKPPKRKRSSAEPDAERARKQVRRALAAMGAEQLGGLARALAGGVDLGREVREALLSRAAAGPDCRAASSQRKAEEKRAKKAKKVERTEGGA
eukprot:COSAG01_NODE_1798_length_9184_cov_6.067860_8_plen_500_part_00